MENKEVVLKKGLRHGYEDKDLQDIAKKRLNSICKRFGGEVVLEKRYDVWKCLIPLDITEDVSTELVIRHFPGELDMGIKVDLPEYIDPVSIDNKLRETSDCFNIGRGRGTVYVNHQISPEIIVLNDLRIDVTYGFLDEVSLELASNCPQAIQDLYFEDVVFKIIEKILTNIKDGLANFIESKKLLNV